MSPWFKATLDVGHFVAGNNDAIDFIEKHHDRITNVHIRDRRRDNGRGTPLGQGNAPIRNVLRLIRDKKYNIRCYLEYEYGSFRSSRDETKRMFDFCQEALA